MALLLLGLSFTLSGGGAEGPADLDRPSPPPSVREAGPSPESTLPSPAATGAEVQELRRDLMAILTSTGNRSGTWGVLAISLDGGDTLLALNHRELMIPASNMKLLTTAVALEMLGSGFRHHTFLLGHGERNGQVLEGDLVLYGTGDPSFSERFHASMNAPLRDLATQVARTGIREVRGDLMVDGSYFHGPELHPDWDPADYNDVFSAPVSAVVYNENTVTVRVEAGQWVGDPPRIFTLPPSAGLDVLNRARTTRAGTRPRVWLFRDTPWDPIGIEGEIPVGGRDVWRRLPVPDPLRFTGAQLQQALEAEGIRVEGSIVSVRDPARSPLTRVQEKGSDSKGPLSVLATVSSPPLVDLLRVVNKESNNLFAEAVGKTLGRVILGEGSYAAGQKVIRDVLIRRVGIPPHELHGRDASGLSPENRVSPGVVVHLLRYMVGSPNWDIFRETLPVAGTRRELGRMYRSPAAGNLRAKTGTMNGVSALSGIVTTRGGERILFSILSNDVGSEYRAKRAEDRLAIRLASLSRTHPN